MNKENLKEEEVKSNLKKPKGINFKMCSECGLPQETNQLNTHWKRIHRDLYSKYKDDGKLNLGEGELPRNPHTEWMDKLMLRLDKYPRKWIKNDPYWEFLYKYVKHYYSCYVWWQFRKVWKLTIPEPSVRE